MSLNRGSIFITGITVLKLALPVSFLDRCWSLSESPLLEPLLLESRYWSTVSEEWFTLLESLLVELSLLVIIYGAAVSGVSLVDLCWFSSSIWAVGISMASF
ncbi:hypothetical protein C2G38_2234464 [Gigaspora rosea]|uniref:Uncharacterized protein n=1 Tax=Gigaspora rosea TaxID=44941 RepID=A0A397TQB8_9GLOM|nr:hypothetical protein C2G38_2234464 [Gigaspora rosea]